jgi:hypothetical protein
VNQPHGVEAISGRFRPLFEGRRKKQDKRALSSAEHICPQCGQRAELRVLSPAAILRGGAVTFSANPLFTGACGTVTERKGEILDEK